MSSTDRVRRWRAANPDRYRELNRIHNAIRTRESRKRKVRPDRKRAINKRYRTQHPEKVAEWNAKRSRALIGVYSRLRRLRRQCATPKWLAASGQSKAIAALYAKARKYGLVVDHDIPLVGCRECGAMGLHVMANLRLATKTDNLSKHARCSGCL